MDAALFGLIVADLITSPMDVHHPPPPGGVQFVKAIELHSGGNVCNTGLAMARMGMKVAGAGLVGKDVLGSAILERLQTGGVDVSCIVADPRAQTSAAIVAVEPGGQRSFFHVPGVTALLDADVFRRSFALFRKCPLLHIAYFGLLPRLTSELPAVLKELRAFAPDTKISFDTADPPAARELLWPILEHVDIFCPSRPEAAALTGEDDPPKMVAALRRHMSRGLIGIKLDAQGCYLDDGKQSVMSPGYAITPVDTTGAGDVWYAGLLTGLRKNMPLEQAARLANRAAADCCTALGAAAGVQSFEQTWSRA